MTDKNTDTQTGPKNIGSALALANAVTIISGVMKGIASRDIADSINGSPLVQSTIAQMACTRISKILQDRHNEARAKRLAGYN